MTSDSTPELRAAHAYWELQELDRLSDEQCVQDTMKRDRILRGVEGGNRYGYNPRVQTHPEQEAYIALASYIHQIPQDKIRAAIRVGSKPPEEWEGTPEGWQALAWLLQSMGLYQLA